MYKKLREEELEEKWGAKREAFKKLIKAEMDSNHALAVLAIEVWVANKHREHIHAMWELLGFHHKEAWDDYLEKLHGKMLTGREDFTKCLYWVDKDLHAKARELPESYVMDDAKKIAETVLG